MDKKTVKTIEGLIEKFGHECVGVGWTLAGTDRNRKHNEAANKIFKQIQEILEKETEND